MGKQVFLSYSSEDEEAAEKLVSDIRGAGFTVWFDQDNLEPGDSLQEKIHEAISKSGVFLACVTANYCKKFKGSWLENELKAALQDEKRSKRLKVIPVRLKRGGSVPQPLGDKAFADLSTDQKWKKNLARLLKRTREIINNEESSGV